MKLKVKRRNLGRMLTKMKNDLEIDKNKFTELFSFLQSTDKHRRRPSHSVVRYLWINIRVESFSTHKLHATAFGASQSRDGAGLPSANMKVGHSRGFCVGDCNVGICTFAVKDKLRGTFGKVYKYPSIFTKPIG